MGDTEVSRPWERLGANHHSRATPCNRAAGAVRDHRPPTPSTTADRRRRGDAEVPDARTHAPLLPRHLGGGRELCPRRRRAAGRRAEQLATRGRCCGRPVTARVAAPPTAAVTGPAPDAVARLRSPRTEHRMPVTRRKRGLPVAVAGMQRLLRGTAGSRRADGLLGATGRVAATVRAVRPWDRAVRDGWLGHALHPLLTDFSQRSLDGRVVPGPVRAARRGSGRAPPRRAGAGRVGPDPSLRAVRLGRHPRRGAACQRPARHQQHDRHVPVRGVVSRRQAAWGAVPRRRPGDPRSVVAFADGYLGGELTLVARAGTGRRLPNYD
jgi:hypothetical protein